MENEEQRELSLSSSYYCCISHVFNRAASNNPTKIAIIQAAKHPRKPILREVNNNNGVHHFNPPLYDGDKFFTFSQLLSAVDSLSFRLHHVLNGGDDPSLIKPTLGNDSHINSNTASKILGVYMVPSVEYVIAVLSILRCGMVFLPLDPSWPKERILFHVLCISIDEILEQKCGKLDVVWPCESRGSRLFSYLMYTSGSTGKPKGVCGTEEGILNRFLWMQEVYPLKGDEVLLFKTSISFVDHLQEFLAPMLAGCTLVVPAFNELRENLFGIVDFLPDYSITRLTAVPSLMRALLPALRDQYTGGVQCSLKLLVLSGEVFPIPLWRDLSRILPRTCILNIYGSTEVSGDCTCFDCQRLPMMLEHEILSNAPIGMTISNCNVKLIEDQKCDEGEIAVTGVCVASGYFSEGNVLPLDNVELSEDSASIGGNQISQIYYRTGDFGRKLPSGDLVFVGRKDRTVKINGQRIALEEVEDTLRAHPSVADVAVVFCNQHKEHAFLGAVLVLKNSFKLSEVLGSIKNWMADRLPVVMIPKEFICTEALPRSSTGKVDYVLISDTFVPVVGSNEDHVEQTDTLEQIKEVFGKALNVAEVGIHDDFFTLGGDSIVAAHVAHKLGIDMRLLYMFPTPSKLQKAFSEKEGLLKIDRNIKWETLTKTHKRELLDSRDSATSDFVKSRKYVKTQLMHSSDRNSPKRSKVDAGLYSNLKVAQGIDFFNWESDLVSSTHTLSRCNKVTYKSNCEVSNLWPETREVKLPRNSKGILREIWRVPLESCVDASPLIVFKEMEILICIGSHSHRFLCVNAKSGSMRWKIKLEGRIECSAMVDGEFAQVVVGCYQGKIYFIDMLTGNLNWSFQTGGEVKSQPAVDKCRNIVWCGSYDHNLYGLDYRNHQCVHQFPCGGSIFGSPAIDEMHDTLYVGTTNGRLTAVSLEDSEIAALWLLELEAPIFGSLSLGCNGNVVCGLVSGDILSVDPTGSMVWRVKTDGPIFAGPCISKALNSQTLVCSRNGNVYSLELKTGRILWEYNAEDPISASAFVDENVKLTSDACLPPERLVCICTSSGRINLLRVSCTTAEDDETLKYSVKKFAELDLQGDIFSSPVMFGGRIFVGCRDDYLHCIVAEALMEND
ncbi:hypothetical protein Cgig2_004061 [Carnegiea gigantea]|uniref:4-coumarate--CoA ligase n=1 Tax=Carnegiea gigantea TaxID=171969 RepID=A0A9Q1KQK3_9CARY|nr:hypothetical protein Cgig2_004061 [Carnegiea gigantea]